MKTLCLFLNVAFVLAIYASSAQGQSFNCQQAGLNLTEQAICQSADLAGKDNELSRLWNLFSDQDRQLMKQGQRRWLKQRNQCGADHNCLIGQYDQRTGDLLETLEDGGSEGGEDTSQVPPPVTLPPPVAGDGGCSKMSQMRSTNTGSGVSISFVNQTQEYRQIYWINFKGQFKPYANIAPNEKFAVNTFTSHPWLIADPKGNCTQIITANSQSRVFALTR